MEQENINDEENNEYITRKIRFYPDKEQTILFNKCINAHRYFYNKSNEYIKNNKLVSAITLRGLIMKSDKDLDDTEKWQSEVPYDTRQFAIRKLVDAYKTSIKLLKNKQIKEFNIRYKSKKENSFYFEVNKNAIKINKDGDIKVFTTRLQNNLRLRKRDKKKIKNIFIDHAYTNTIIKKEYDKWYICLVIPNIKHNINKPVFDNVFLDPGVRTFQTFYSPNGLCGKLGNEIAKTKLKPLTTKYSNLQSIIDKEKNKSTKKHLKKRCGKLITKVKNIVSDFHNQSANTLTTLFKHIFIPEFNVKDMVKSDKRKIYKNSVKSLLNLSHYKFSTKLKSICKTRGNKIFIINEAYTSQTCGVCGKLNEDLKDKKIFKCSECNLEIDRDLNAARNICLRNITFKKQLKML